MLCRPVTWPVVTSKDNVHPTLGFLTSLACAILLVRKKSRNLSLPGAKGLLPVGLSFSNFLKRELERRESGRAIPDDCYNPLLHQYFLRPSQLWFPAWIICQIFPMESDILHKCHMISGLVTPSLPLLTLNFSCDPDPRAPSEYSKLFHRRCQEHKHLLCLASLKLNSDIVKVKL